MIKNQSNLFTDNLCLGIASITPENEAATAEKYCNDYELITKYNFNNGTEYIDRFLIVPKDDTVLFDLYSVKITDEGTIEPEFEIDKDIDEPILFTYDEEKFFRYNKTYVPLSDLPFPKVSDAGSLISELNSLTL